MSYIGNPPAEAYTNTVKDSFSGDGSTVAFTLSRPSLTNDVRVVVENVIQDPTVAYSVSGTTLTFTSAPPSGTNNIYVVHLGPAVQTTVPPDGVTVTDLNAYGDGAAAFTANRASSDGTIADFRKDGSSVGRIGAYLSGTTIGNGNTNLHFWNSQSGIFPYDAGTGTHNDGVISFGNPNYRFKDLYLSGGVYVGGTVAANYLDDYEEGSWTPSFSFSSGSVGYAQQLGMYVKIGSLVFWNAAIFLNSVSSPSGNVHIAGLPFTNKSGEQYVTGPSYALVRNLANSFNNLMGYNISGDTEVFLSTNATNQSAIGLSATNFTSSTGMYISGTYQAA